MLTVMIGIGPIGIMMSGTGPLTTMIMRGIVRTNIVMSETDPLPMRIMRIMGPIDSMIAEIMVLGETKTGAIGGVALLRRLVRQTLNVLTPIAPLLRR